MNLHATWETKKVLIVVRTYPTPSEKSIEVSCTAGITESGKWLRLFPIPSRFLSEEKNFRKYQWIEVSARQSTSDPRQESYKINHETIQLLTEPLPTTNEWAARKDIVYPLCSPSLCKLQRDLNNNGNAPTLGVFRPKRINRLIIRPETADWTPNELSKLRKPNLFDDGPVQELEKVPWKFIYYFHCEDDQCSGHNLSCTDWELGQSWRSWKDKYGVGWEAKFREKYEREMINAKETHFFVGTVHLHPKNWIIVGLFYPPIPKIQSLFD